MLRRCVWSRNIKNGCPIYIYDISHLRVKEGVAFTAFYSKHPKSGCYFPCWSMWSSISCVYPIPRIKWMPYFDSCGESVRLCEVSCFEVCVTLLLQRRIVDILGRQIWYKRVGNFVLSRPEVGIISTWPRATSHWPYYNVLLLHNFVLFAVHLVKQGNEVHCCRWLATERRLLGEEFPYEVYKHPTEVLRN